MRISNTDWPSAQVPDSRRLTGQARPPNARSRAVAEGDSPPHAEQPPRPEGSLEAPLRQRILELQRSAAGLQRALAGLEGFRQFFETQGAGVSAAVRVQSAEEYLGAVRYRGQAVLRPYAEGLREALLRGEHRTLEGTIAEVSEALRSRAVELGRFETAAQNSRSLAGPADPLAALMEAVRGAGEELLEPEGRGALDLLG
ncbi:MAG: hypothetical protein ABH877_03795 [bacterium]